MESLDPLFTSVLSSGSIPGAVLAGSSLDGRFNYLKAFGRTFCEADFPALATDATFWLASATKLFTAVAALQCVDKVLVSLDEDIGRALPELKTFVILKGWDENEQPILEEAETQISLRFVYYIFLPTMATFCLIGDRPAHEVLRLRNRMLLSHTSGLVYEFTSPAIQKCLKLRARSSGSANCMQVIYGSTGKVSAMV